MKKKLKIASKLVNFILLFSIVFQINSIEINAEEVELKNEIKVENQELVQPILVSSPMEYSISTESVEERNLGESPISIVPTANNSIRAFGDPNNNVRMTTKAGPTAPSSVQGGTGGWAYPEYFLDQNGHIIWCYQPFKVVTSNANQQPYPTNEWNEFTRTQQQNMIDYANISEMFYRTTGNPEYLFAGQVLIWTAGGYEVYGWPSAYQNEINDMQNFKSQLRVAPSFAYGTHTLKYNPNIGCYEVILHDNNNVLDSHYSHMGGQYGDYYLSLIGGNNLKITTSNHYASQQNIKSPVYDPFWMVPKANDWYDGSQDLFKLVSDPINFSFNLKTEPALGKAKLCKVNQNGVPLAGVEFDIFKSNGQYLGTDKTGADGCFTTGNLVVGDYYAKEIRASSPDIIIDGNTKYPFTIRPNTITTITDTNGSVKVDNFQFGTITGRTMYAEMNDTKVNFTFDVTGYVDPNLNKLEAKIYQDNILMSTQDITIKPGLNSFNFDVPINITSNNAFARNAIRIELKNKNGSMYKIENQLDVPRYFPSNEIINVNSTSGSYRIETPIATESWIGKGGINYSHSYESFNFDNMYQDLKVVNGTFPINQNVTYYNYLNKNMDTLDQATLTMYQPLPDSTFQFDQVNNMYEFNVGYDSSTGEIYLKDFYGEIENGRFYQANTDKIDNPTTDQKTLYEGYVDKNDILKRVDKTYPLPVKDPDLIGTGTKYPVKLKVEGVGYNKFNIEFNMTFDYVTKQISTINGKSLKNPKIIPLADYDLVTNPPARTQENYVKECNDRESFLQANYLINNNEEWRTTYLSTDLTRINACEVYITYPELQNQSDDYYLDYGDYSGSGIYEDNYVGKSVIIQTEQDFIK